MKEIRESTESLKGEQKHSARLGIRWALLLMFIVGCWSCSGPVSQTNQPTNQAPVSGTSPSVAGPGLGGPLILDIRGDGLDLSGRTKTNLATGSIQDLGWTKPNTDDAFLVLDATAARLAGIDVRDKDGRQVSGLTLLRDGLRIRDPNGRETTVTDGWDMLSSSDANGDGRINSSDGVGPHLKLFTDADADGTISSDEIKSIADSVVADFRLTGLSSSRVDQFGNAFVDGSFTRKDGTTGVISGVRLGSR